ncbi:tRNA (cytosine(72)-C(5))-methyltransferase NSUN6-like [Lycorma delicatula]|uniref:tRNA (cytosine(72)-C(5))-methyltransferase NSUN6-like n=1 Tax=Lycorma delicatula TaxID=130591 RepID=UPI003F515855
MCAAPGNKTTHIASLMKGKGQIIALDKTEKKIERIKENCKNQHLNNVSAYVFDATKAFDGNCITERGRVKAPPYNENTFDRILLDAPCSALGQRPQLSQSLSFKQADSFPLLQKRHFKAYDIMLAMGTNLSHRKHFPTESVTHSHRLIMLRYGGRVISGDHRQDAVYVQICQCELQCSDFVCKMLFGKPFKKL